MFWSDTWICSLPHTAAAWRTRRKKKAASFLGPIFWAKICLYQYLQLVCIQSTDLKISLPRRKKIKEIFFSLLISEAALTQFSSKACSWDGSNLVLAAPPNLKSIRNSKTKAALVSTSSLNPSDFLGQLSHCLCSRLVYCKIPEEATEEIQEAIFKSALVFLLGWF